MKFRCYVTKIGKNSDIEYIACCITINLLSIGTIKEHTIKNLELLINDYINFYKENIDKAVKDEDYKFFILTRMHAQACQITGEILKLLT